MSADTDCHDPPFDFMRPSGIDALLSSVLLLPLVRLVLGAPLSCSTTLLASASAEAEADVEALTGGEGDGSGLLGSDGGSAARDSGSALVLLPAVVAGFAELLPSLPFLSVCCLTTFGDGSWFTPPAFIKSFRIAFNSFCTTVNSGRASAL